MLTVLRDMKGTVTIDFLEKNSTINSDSYCQLIGQNSPYLLRDPRIFFHQSAYFVFIVQLLYNLCIVSV